MAKKILRCFGGVILLSFTLFVVNQTLAVVQLAERVSPTFGQVVLWGLFALYAMLLIMPVILFIRLPKALSPPAENTGPHYDDHIAHLSKRLAGNELLTMTSLGTNAQVEEAIQLLDQRVNEIVSREASRVFMTTAISQYGKLDTLAILSIQSKMIWEIAHVYYQRFSFRDAIYLYSNVATSAFVAYSIDEIDVEEQIEPLVTAATPSLFGAIPGMGTVSSVLIGSVVTGTTNAFLTLRVGMIAKRYCGLLVMASPISIRKAATTEALKLLRPIMWNGVKVIGANVKNIAKSKMSKTTGKIKEKLARREDEPQMLEANPARDVVSLEIDDEVAQQEGADKKKQSLLSRG